MGAALVRVDRVRVREDVLGVARRPLHRDLERDLALGVFGLEVDDLVVDVLGLADAVEVLDVVDEPALVEEAVVALLQDDLAGLGLLLVCRCGTLVAQVDAQPLVEERHLLEARAQGLVLEVDGLEDRLVGPERDRRAGLVALLGTLERCLGHAAVAVGLPPDVALATHLDLEPARERVDDGGAHAVQTARDGIPAAAELSAGVQHGQHDLDGRLALGLVHVDRDAATVVDDAHRAVRQDRDDDRVAVAGERLVDGVVDDLVHEVVQTARSGRADVHAGALAHRLEALEDLDLVGAVLDVSPFGLHRFRGMLFGLLGQAVRDLRRHILGALHIITQGTLSLPRNRSRASHVRPCGGLDFARIGREVSYP